MEEGSQKRPTGRIPRPAVQETSAPDRKPLAQWVVSGKTVLPADEVYGAGGCPPPASRWKYRLGLVAGLAAMVAAALALLW